MSMAIKKRWTAKDVREFDRLVTLMDSRSQMARIDGRIKLKKFEARFTKAEMDEMWQKIKDKG